MRKTAPSEKETQLVLDLKARNERALGDLYDQYGDALFGVILKIVIDEAVAEDLLQEVFIKIWKNIPRYDAKKGRLFTWMLNIARNRSIDYRRSKAFKQSTQVQTLENSVGMMTGTSGVTEQNVDTIGLREQVDKLPPNLKEVLEILYFRGFTQTEASEELGIPLGTVKSRLRIALREIRKFIN